MKKKGTSHNSAPVVNKSASTTKDSSAYKLFRKFPRTLAKELQTFLILSPAHDLSVHHLQVSVHIVKVIGLWNRHLAVCATITNPQYKSKQITLLKVFVTKQNVLQIQRPSETLQTMLNLKTYAELRDEVCSQVLAVLLEESQV